MTVQGDKIRVVLPRSCPSELKAAIRANKADILAVLEAKTANLPAECGPWIHVAKQIVDGEFEGADGSTIESLMIGLRGVKHPNSYRALDRLSKLGKRPR